MSPLQIKPRTDTWMVASWDDYVRAIADPLYAQAKGYYYKGHMRMMIGLRPFPQEPASSI